MRQEQFVARYQAEWQAFEHWLETREALRKALSERNTGSSRSPASAATARW